MPSCQKAESADFPKENSRGPRNLSPKRGKGRSLKYLASTLKKLELNSTNLVLKSKKTRLDCAKTPDPSISYGLKVKNKTNRVLLDFESSGDLLFMKKGSSKQFLLQSRLSLSRGALQMPTSSQTGC
jgi:hypothetical protein